MSHALFVLGIVVLFVVGLLAPGLHPAHRTKPEPTYVDECETCGRQLTADEVHELRSDPADDVEAEFGGVGGTFMSATYCAEHYPKETS